MHKKTFRRITKYVFHEKGTVLFFLSHQTSKNLTETQRNHILDIPSPARVCYCSKICGCQKTFRRFWKNLPLCQIKNISNSAHPLWFQEVQRQANTSPESIEILFLMYSRLLPQGTPLNLTSFASTDSGLYFQVPSGLRITLRPDEVMASSA